MNCGRAPGGEKTAERGVCPAAADASFTGINGGKCGGRFCWAVAGTSGAARLLGVPESTLRSRMKKLGIKRTTGRSA